MKNFKYIISAILLLVSFNSMAEYKSYSEKRFEEIQNNPEQSIILNINKKSWHWTKTIGDDWYYTVIIGDEKVEAVTDDKVIIPNKKILKLINNYFAQKKKELENLEGLEFITQNEKNKKAYQKQIEKLKEDLKMSEALKNVKIKVDSYEDDFFYKTHSNDELSLDQLLRSRGKEWYQYYTVDLESEYRKKNWDNAVNKRQDLKKVLAEFKEKINKVNYSKEKKLLESVQNSERDFKQALNYFINRGSQLSNNKNKMRLINKEVSQK